MFERLMLSLAHFVRAVTH